MDRMLKAGWAGNVRELENSVERGVIMCRGEYITERELPMTVTTPEEQFPDTSRGSSLGGVSLSDLEKKAIMDTLDQTGNNKSESARILGITRATLHNKLKKYDLG